MYLSSDEVSTNGRIKKSVSTEINKELQERTGVSSEELDMILSGNLEELEQFTPIDRVVPK